jgi:hypothetical protein
VRSVIARATRCRLLTFVRKKRGVRVCVYMIAPFLLSFIFAYFHLLALICASLGSAGPSACEILISRVFLKLWIDELREQA